MADRDTALHREHHGDRIELTIRNPVIDGALLEEMAATLDALARTAGTLPLVLRSTHPTVFLAGADLREIAALDEATCAAYAAAGRRVVSRLILHSAPTVAAVHGSCSGGGFDLVMACDTVVAHPRATFRHPGIHRGLVTGWSGTTLLPHALGPRVARLAMLEGRALDACTMQALGVVRKVTENVESTAAEIALELASLDPWRLAIWRSSRGPGFVDRFRATVVHKL
jgi:3-hydroxyacyl-CoA dehydrogenase/enoyl-CoA hydratase/3-hydroxybutyryl-CoA epimerase